jgi:hypothetical protein
MAAVVTGVAFLLQGQPAIERLVAEVAAGVGTYAVVLVLIDRETVRLLGSFAADLKRLRAPTRQEQPAE